MRVFGNEDHKAYLSDCIEVLEEHIPDGSIDLIFADPLYNIGKSFNGKIERITEDGYLPIIALWAENIRLKDCAGAVKLRGQSATIQDYRDLARHRSCESVTPHRGGRSAVMIRSTSPADRRA